MDTCRSSSYYSQTLTPRQEEGTPPRQKNSENVKERWCGEWRDDKALSLSKEERWNRSIFSLWFWVRRRETREQRRTKKKEPSMLFCFCSENINANDVASVLMCVSFGVIIDVMRMSILIMVSSVRPPPKNKPHRVTNVSPQRATRPWCCYILHQKNKSLLFTWCSPTRPYDTCMTRRTDWCKLQVVNTGRNKTSPELLLEASNSCYTRV